MKTQTLASGVLAALVLTAALVRPAVADDTIFTAPVQPAAQPTVVTAETLGASPTMRDHKDEVMAAADTKLNQMELDGVVTPAEKIQIKGWFKELPFQRIVDVKLSFLSGIPDMFGLCLQTTPVYYVSIDACAGSIIFISSLSVHVSSRFLHYQNIKGERKANGQTDYSGDEFSVGPSIGVRTEAVLGIDQGGTAMGFDAQISGEWVHWFSRYFGMGLQLDGGVTYNFEQNPSPDVTTMLPNAKLSLGFSF